MSGRSVRGVVGQSVVEQHRIVTLNQDRDMLIQKAGLSSFAGVDSQPPTKIVQEVIVIIWFRLGLERYQIRHPIPNTQ